jgi:hypothetical protein
MIVPLLSECCRIIEELLRPEDSILPAPRRGTARAAGVAKAVLWYALALAAGLALARLGA